MTFEVCTQDKSKKGQFNIEYLIAFILFSVVILYLSVEAADMFPEVAAERSRFRKESEANRIASFLAETERGFAEDTGFLWKQDKINSFEERCNDDYYAVRDGMGLDVVSGFQVSIYEKGSGFGETVCEGPPVPSGVSLGTSSRFGYIDGEGIVKLEVIVW